MKKTPAYMEKMFNHINVELFEGDMEMPVFGVLNDWLALSICGFELDGVCLYDNPEGVFYVGVHKNLSNQEFFNALVHELIHVHLITHNNYSGHGYLFQNMCRKAIDVFYTEKL